MRFNPGYWFGTQTALGRMIMRRYKHNPGPILKFMRLLPKLGLYNEKAIEFYIHQVTFEPMREKVYKVWMSHRYTVINRRKVSEIIKRHQIPVFLFFGRFDSVIPPVLGENFAKLAGPSAHLCIIDTGHRLPEKHQEISEVILNSNLTRRH
jgi:pimeloyl-ACP methyl ester carboxylesterase